MQFTPKKINVIISAGGASQRFGQKNKLFEPLNSSCVLLEAIKPFLTFDNISRVIVGIDSSYSDELLAALDNANINDNRIVISAGGDTRTKTVRNALTSLERDADAILSHDGARPFVSRQLISRALDALKTADAALCVVPSTDALVYLDGDVPAPFDRKQIRRVQTPFAAKRDIFEKAYLSSKSAFYDDFSVIKTLDNVKIAVFDGDEKNIKITYPSDLENLKTPIVGCGYDIHRMKSGDGIKLCGTTIKCPFSFIAHSDGDVPVHALMDAILSALGKKDIGHYFPVDDPSYDGANSMDLLNQTLKIASSCGYKVGNASISIIAEQPRLSPYIDSMRSALAAALSVSLDNVGISATTNEQVGDLGSSTAIASFATVSLFSI